MRVEILVKKDRENFIKEFNASLNEKKARYILVVSPEDTFKNGSSDRKYLDEMAEALADILDMNESAVLATPKKLFQFPNRITGVMFRTDMIEERLDDRFLYNYEADFLLRLISNNDFLVNQNIEYTQGDPGDGNFYMFHGIYDRRWYIDSLRDFFLPLTERYDEIPYMVKVYIMYGIVCRLNANQNYNNRHVLNEKDISVFKELIGEILQHIDDNIIMSARRYPVYKRDFQFCRMLLRIKYEYLGKEMDGGLYLRSVRSEADTDFDSEEYHYSINTRYPALMVMCEGMPVYSTSYLRCNINLMDVKGGRLEIDGSVPDIFDKKYVRYFFETGGKRYEPEFCERYSLTKYFGLSAYKRYPFHVSIPLKNISSDGIRFYLEERKKDDSQKYAIYFEFKSHTSRLSSYPRNSYWHAGKYLFTNEISPVSAGDYGVSAIKVERYSWAKMAIKEMAVGWELLTSFQSHRLHFLMLRMAWVITYPFFGRKKIWFFFDKIYKGGDSSEYMYKYTVQKMKEKDKGAPEKAYYLLDSSAPDYRRLKSEGYNVLARGSYLHRLVFLNADVLVASNSTVFAFNDYYLENSRYIRGIPDFKVACVQHGLSVQKIAVAQQRLRDNTRRYFLASKVEQENLLHPVYDYKDYDVLRMTGIPRYDGLVNEDKKQIMISPTWRMQSARLVSRHEGFERDYNEEFRETSYFKVYNSLINDEKLIRAAEKYGYRIKFVLHPIVSPQAKDFDTNEYVDIIPSVGDMSYEKLFRESSLMVTDYSGIQFDFAYMRKPLVYYHPDELEAHYEEGTYHYDTMAFGEIVRKKDELINVLAEYMKNGCEMKELYKMRVDSFFTYNDRNNCSRVYEELKKM